MWVQNYIKLSAAYALMSYQVIMSYQQWTRFWTTLNFDREYLWNGSSNRQAENVVMNYAFFHIRRKMANFGPLTKNDIDLCPVTWNSLGSVRWSRNMVVHNFIELSAAVHELSCARRKKNWDEYNRVRRYLADSSGIKQIEIIAVDSVYC